MVGSIRSTKTLFKKWFASMDLCLSLAFSSLFATAQAMVLFQSNLSQLTRPRQCLAFAQLRIFSRLPVHVLHPTFPFHPKATTTHTHTAVSFFFSILTCPLQNLISFPNGRSNQLHCLARRLHPRLLLHWSRLLPRLPKL